MEKDRIVDVALAGSLAMVRTKMKERERAFVYVCKYVCERD